MTDDQPKKISADQVQILGADGEVVKDATDQSARYSSHANHPFGQMRVIQGGPWLMLLLPVIIPVVIVGFFILMILALIFGRGMFKVFKGQIRPRG